MQKSMFFLLCCFAVANVKAQEPTAKKSITNAMWLIGSWKGMHNGQPFYEAWRKANDSVLVNFSIEFKNGDTVVKEETPIIFNGPKTVFGKPPAQWSLTRVMTNELVFENDTLRFSNRIIWLHTAEDHWFTILQNPKSTVYYDMVRTPQLEAVVDRFIAAARNKPKG